MAKALAKQSSLSSHPFDDRIGHGLDAGREAQRVEVGAAAQLLQGGLHVVVCQPVRKGVEAQGALGPEQGEDLRQVVRGGRPSWHLGTGE